MADSKITALTAISTVDPTADPLVIVDVSDTSMAASGTTKKSTINQLLGAGGTATLASATITGDLTAARLIVTGGTIPTNGLWLPTTNTLEFAANSLAQYRIAPLGVFSWFDGAGGTRMTLNSTGLGVGVTPTNKLTIGTGSFNADTVSGSASLYATVSQGLVVLADGFVFGTRAGVKRLDVDTSGNIISNLTSTAPTLSDNGFMVFNLTSNTNLRISVRGTDGVTRTANLTLA